MSGYLGMYEDLQGADPDLRDCQQLQHLRALRVLGCWPHRPSDMSLTTPVRSPATGHTTPPRLEAFMLLHGPPGDVVIAPGYRS